MRGRDRYRDARFADLDAADAVGDGDREQVVAAKQLLCDPLHLLLCHALEGLVVEVRDGAAPRCHSGRPDECGDRPGSLVSDLGDHGLEVDRVAGEPEGAA